MSKWIFLAAVLLAGSAQAQPSSVTGTVADGETITINGSGMGAYAAPWYFEDFEVDDITDTEFHLQDSPHYATTLKEAELSTVAKREGSKSMIIAFLDSTQQRDFAWGNLVAKYYFPEEIPLGGKLYISLWVKWDWGNQCDCLGDPINNLPSTLNIDNQFKICRIGAMPWSAPNNNAVGVHMPYVRFWAHTSCAASMGQRSIGLQYYTGTNAFYDDTVHYPGVYSASYETGYRDIFSTHSLLQDEWHHVEWEILANTIENGSRDGSYRLYISRRGERSSVLFGEGIGGGFMGYSDEHRWGAQAVGGYMSSSDHSANAPAHAEHFYDNYYINNGWQRVVLGDAPTYDGCYIREPQPYTSWTANAIEVGPLVATGFAADDPAWLYVVGEDGVANAPLEVTIGLAGGGEPGAPGAPTNLTATEID